MTQYPPLKALVAFDAAMRSNSFSLAANELCVTPGAIGQQIQKLEEWLEVPLFIRQIRQVQPTEAAVAYWQKIQPALAMIADASKRLEPQSKYGCVTLHDPHRAFAHTGTHLLSHPAHHHGQPHHQLWRDGSADQRHRHAMGG